MEGARLATQKTAIRSVVREYIGMKIKSRMVEMIVKEMEYEMTEGPCAWAFKEDSDG